MKDFLNYKKIGVMLFSFCAVTATAKQIGNNVTWNVSQTTSLSRFDSTVPENSSQLIFIRADEDKKDEHTKVRIDRKFLGSLNYDKYVTEVICPGVHSITLSSTKDDVKKLTSFIATKANTNTFVLINNKKLTIQEISAEKAKQLFNDKHLKLQTHQISRVKSQCQEGTATPVAPINLYFLFPTNKADVTTADNAQLKAIGSFMQKNEDVNVLLIGHTDSVASAKYNLALSKKRANTVKHHLVTEYHISPSRIKTTGLGETNPIASNQSESGRQKNRRVELQFSAL